MCWTADRGRGVLSGGMGRAFLTLAKMTGIALGFYAAKLLVEVGVWRSASGDVFYLPEYKLLLALSFILPIIALFVLLGPGRASLLAFALPRRYAPGAPLAGSSDAPAGPQSGGQPAKNVRTSTPAAAAPPSGPLGRLAEIARALAQTRGMRVFGRRVASLVASPLLRRRWRDLPYLLAVLLGVPAGLLFLAAGLEDLSLLAIGAGPAYDRLIELSRPLGHPLDTAGALVTLGVAAPLAHEILFRGLLLGVALERHPRPGPALYACIFWQALLSGAGELNPWGFAAGVIAGLAFAWMRIWSGALLAPAAAHTVWGLAAAALHYFAPHLPVLGVRRPDAPVDEMLPALAMLIPATLLIIGALWIIRGESSRDWPEEERDDAEEDVGEEDDHETDEEEEESDEDSRTDETDDAPDDADPATSGDPAGAGDSESDLEADEDDARIRAGGSGDNGA